MEIGAGRRNLTLNSLTLSLSVFSDTQLRRLFQKQNHQNRTKQELSHPGNEGLADVVEWLKPIAEAAAPRLSLADVIQLAAAVVVEGAGGPVLGFEPGRRDSWAYAPEGRLFDPRRAAREVAAAGNGGGAGAPTSAPSSSSAVRRSGSGGLASSSSSPNSSSAVSAAQARDLRAFAARLGMPLRHVVALAGAHRLGRWWPDAGEPAAAAQSSRLSVPRGGGPLVSASASSSFFSTLSGASSFGMSGVNAHALVLAGDEETREGGGWGGGWGDGEGQQQWSRQSRRRRRQLYSRTRCWFGPARHAALSSFSFSSASSPPSVTTTARFSVASLGATPALAFLRDHVVSGRAVLPGAAALEVVAAALRSLLLLLSTQAPQGQRQQQQQQPSTLQSPLPLLLSNAAFVSPVVIGGSGRDGAGSAAAAAAELELVVDCSKGSRSTSCIAPH